MTERIEELTAQAVSLEEAAARRKDPDELARSLLASAQRAAREERESTREECELILRKAQRRAERIEEQFVRHAQGRLSELARLEALRDEVIARLRATLAAIADRHSDGANSGNGLGELVVPAEREQ